MSPSVTASWCRFVLKLPAVNEIRVPSTMPGTQSVLKKWYQFFSRIVTKGSSHHQKRCHIFDSGMWSWGRHRHKLGSEKKRLHMVLILSCHLENSFSPSTYVTKVTGEKPPYTLPKQAYQQAQEILVLSYFTGVFCAFLFSPSPFTLELRNL